LSPTKSNLTSYVESFSKDAREIFEHFKFAELVSQLQDANLLYKVALAEPGIIRTIYDLTAGTGGFLSSGMEYVHELNPDAEPVIKKIVSGNALAAGKKAKADPIHDSVNAR
jgi:hypothetical protein